MNRKRRIAMILAPWVFTALPTLLLVAAGWRTAPAQEAVPETTPLLLSQKNKQTALKRDAEFKEIHFTITTDKSRYAQGETVTLTLSAYNRGTKPATVALPLFDGGVSSSVTLAVINAKTDEPLRISQGEFYAGRERQEAVQVMVHPQIAAKRFVIVPPGETVPIASKKFERAYLLGNRAPQRKSEMTAAERNEKPFQTAPIPAGTYRLRAEYHWDKGASFFRQRFFKEPKFADREAAERYENAIIGRVFIESAEAFEVTTTSRDDSSTEANSSTTNGTRQPKN
jgi:hypothetical protein